MAQQFFAFSVVILVVIFIGLLLDITKRFRQLQTI